MANVDSNLTANLETWVAPDIRILSVDDTHAGTPGVGLDAHPVYPESQS